MIVSRRRFIGTAAATLAFSSSVRIGDAFAQEKPQYGGHLRIGYALEPTSLDPMVGRSGGDIYYLRGMFDVLVDADPVGQPSPNTSLAVKWEVSENPHALTLTLREGVKFHDGTPFNAESVKFNLDRNLDPANKATSRASLTPIQSVEVLGEYLVKLNLSGPWAPAFGVFSDRGGMINSPTAVQKLGQDYGWNPSGTGPFKLKEVVTGSYVHMVRNENYWGTDEQGNKLPYLDEVTIKIIKDEKVLTSSLKSGDIDACFLPGRDLAEFKANNDFHVESMEGSAIGTLLVFNPDVAPMDNVDLRRAVAQAVDPDAINKAVFFGTSTPSDSGMWPINSWAYEKNDARLKYDPAKAKESLAKGGKPDGFQVNILTWSSAVLQQATEIVRAQLGQVGISATIDVQSVGAATEKFFAQKQTPIYLTSWSRIVEPDYLASTNFKSGGYYNPSAKENPEMDKLVAAGISTYDQEKRKEIYKNLNSYILDNALWQPLIYSTTYAAAPVKVQNLRTLIGPDGRMQVKNLWMKKG